MPNAVHRFTSGLVVIPLQDPKELSAKLSRISTDRSFTKGNKLSSEANQWLCPIVDDTGSSSFEVKPFQLKQQDQQFVLHDGQTSFKTLPEFTGTSNRKPHGAAILSHENLKAVGILSCSEDGKISPLWLSHDNLSSFGPSSLKKAQLLQQFPVEQQSAVKETPDPDFNANLSANFPSASTKDNEGTVISSEESAQNGKKPRNSSQSDEADQSNDRVKIAKVESSAGHHSIAEETEADCKSPSELTVPEPGQVTGEEAGAVAASKESPQDIKTLKNFPVSNPGSGSQVVIKITPQNLDDQQKEKYKKWLKDFFNEYVDSHDDVTSQRGQDDLLNYLRKTHGILIETLALGCLEITVQCPTLKSLESLWNDYCSGHLNDVAERYLVTEKILIELEVETMNLKTTITEEDYLACTRSLLETLRDQQSVWHSDKASIEDTFRRRLGDAGSTSRQEPEGASAILIPEFSKEKYRDMSWKIRAEEAKKSRGALHKAAINGHCETVKALLRNGEDVDQLDKFLLTPLHLAAWYGHESVVQLLLQHGANVNAVDKFQKTALQKAERHNHQSIVKLLLKHNATSSYQPLSLKSLSRNAFLHVDRSSGINLLQAAVLEGKYDTVWNAHALLGDYVKEMNFEKTASNAKCFPGKTAADILSSLDKKEKGHVDIETLYKEGVEKQNTLTDLHLCKCCDDAEKAVELVLNDGVDINIPAKSNRTPLLWASLSSSGQYIKTLIDLGADVNVQRTDDKDAPLYLAASWNNYITTRVLLEYGADVNIQNKEGSTPLHDCARQGHFTVSQLLIESGCNVNLRNKSDKTPIYVAVENKHVHLVKLLLESNTDVNMRYKQDPSRRLYLVRGKDKGRPAWHYVMVEKSLLGLFLKKTNGGRLDVADFGTVLKSGWGKDPSESIREEINEKVRSLYKEIQGNTLLHLASEKNNTKLMELLVTHGADINCRDAEGFTQLHMAAVHGKMQIIKKLVELGADVNVTTSDENSAVDLAQLNEETEVEEYLKSKGGLPKRNKEKSTKEETKETKKNPKSKSSFLEEAIRNVVLVNEHFILADETPSIIGAVARQIAAGVFRFFAN